MLDARGGPTGRPSTRVRLSRGEGDRPEPAVRRLRVNASSPTITIPRGAPSPSATVTVLPSSATRSTAHRSSRHGSARPHEGRVDGTTRPFGADGEVVAAVDGHDPARASAMTSEPSWLTASPRADRPPLPWWCAAGGRSPNGPAVTEPAVSAGPVRPPPHLPLPVALHRPAGPAGAVVEPLCGPHQSGERITRRSARLHPDTPVLPHTETDQPSCDRDPCQPSSPFAHFGDTHARRRCSPG